MSDDKPTDETPLERSEHAIDDAKEAAERFEATQRESVLSEDPNKPEEGAEEAEDVYEHEPAPKGPTEPAPGA